MSQFLSALQWDKIDDKCSLVNFKLKGEGVHKELQNGL